MAILTPSAGHADVIAVAFVGEESPATDRWDLTPVPGHRLPSPQELSAAVTLQANTGPCDLLGLTECGLLSSDAEMELA